MPIDVTVPNSPGWWMARGAAKLKGRQQRLARLANYHEGTPDLPVDENTINPAFRKLQQESCTNFAELIVGSVRERCSVRDIRTALSADQSDPAAWQIWRDNGLDVEFADVLENMLALGDAYMIVGRDDGRPVITGEDPRQVVTFHDPTRQSVVIAAFKSFRDSENGIDYAVLWLPGTVDEAGDVSNARQWVASRSFKGTPAVGAAFFPTTYDWEPNQGGSDGTDLGQPYTPVVRFRNRRGVGEFEPHIWLLDRINKLTYDRNVIALYQAFRQRAVMVDVSEDAVDEAGNPVDLIPDDLLTSDPGSWIQLPANAKIWESAQADLQGISGAINDDVKKLAAVTRRPMAIFAPDNQSASGADFTREGLTFATEDKQVRAGQAIVQVMRLAFLTVGDIQRADASQIIVGWNPADRYSLTDMANATAQAKGVLPKRTIYRDVWQQNPAQIDQIEAEAADEALLDQELTAGAVAA